MGISEANAMKLPNDLDELLEIAEFFEGLGFTPTYEAECKALWVVMSHSLSRLHIATGKQVTGADLRERLQLIEMVRSMGSSAPGAVSGDGALPALKTYLEYLPDGLNLNGLRTNFRALDRHGDNELLVMQVVLGPDALVPDDTTSH